MARYQSLWCHVKARKHKRRPPVPVRFKSKSEKFFLEAVVKHFESKGWKAHHHDTRNPRYAWVIGKGFPDLVLVKRIKRKGRTKVRVLWAELKTEKGYASTDQRKWLDLLPDSTTFLWRPSDWTEIREVARAK